MKQHVKKKRYLAFCREQVMTGNVNREDGTWRRADTTKAMDRDMLAGYRYGRK